jgi:hypothetical protein
MYRVRNWSKSIGKSVPSRSNKTARAIDEPPCTCNWLQATPSFAITPIAHELGHAFLFVTTGTGDGGLDHQNNTGPIWGPGGKIDQINQALIAAGL